MKYRLFLVVVAVATAIWPSSRGSAQELTYEIFGRYLEPVVQGIGMPGLAALITREGRVEWQKGYGYADVDRKIPATIDTPFAIGGVTQAITGVLVGICIDRHQIPEPGIDRPIREWVPTFPEASATVRHVLAHASKGRYEYDPAAYTALTPVVEQCSKTTYRQATVGEILDQLAMRSSVPGLDLDRPEGAAARELFSEPVVSNYRALLRTAAVPYRVDRNLRPIRSEYPSYGLDAAGGLVATAHDLYRFESALYDPDPVPLSRSTLNQMWSATTIADANGNPLTLPTGLGWFVTRESGQDLVWTFGHIPDAGSALILKLPSKNLTLILLSNSGLLASGYGFEQGRVTESPFVKIFLRLFI
jgi:CubicO group peptidase (beta-lactamase class C family)